MIGRKVGAVDERELRVGQFSAKFEKMSEERIDAPLAETTECKSTTSVEGGVRQLCVLDSERIDEL